MIIQWPNSLCGLSCILLLPLQPNARKEDLFGRPSQGLYSSSYMATKGLAEASMDRNCLEVNMGSSLPSPSQVYHPSSLDKHAGSYVLIFIDNKRKYLHTSKWNSIKSLQDNYLLDSYVHCPIEALEIMDRKAIMDIMGSRFVQWILEHGLCFVFHFHISILSS